MSTDSNTRNSDTSTAVGSISQSDYARRCKELMDLHSSLSKLGAAGLLDLPMIVVIGGQSAGKSSLVEAVSGINVPRDSGTCTRCPMECSLTASSSQWSCDIFLCFEYDSAGVQLSSATIEKFCVNLEDKAQVELWLRRAQMAILSPHKPHNDFAQMAIEELRSLSQDDVDVLKFSKNKIRIEINDPDATNLSFMDLPGLIQNETPETIELVRGLVEDKIGGVNSSNALILVTVPMSDDMENQQAILLARQADPDGERSIVVLTKPDTLSRGATAARMKWKDIIEGNNRKHALKHGYYCVRLSDDDERVRNITRTESQRNAAEYFRRTPPWSTMDSGRFGIPVFVKNISELLMSMIEKNLPKLRQDVEERLEECRQKLATLPAPVTRDAATEVYLRVTSFCQDLRAAVYGDRFKKLAQNNRQRYLRFKIAIRSTAPDFRPFIDYDQYLVPHFDEPEHEPIVSDVSDVDEASEGLDGTGPLDLVYVRQVIKNSISWELPGHVPFEATRELILGFTRLWHDPTMKCFNDAFSNLAVMVHVLMKDHFGSFDRLLACVRHVTSLLGFDVTYVIRHSSVVVEELNKRKKEALAILHKTLELETTPVFTHNTHYLESLGKSWLVKYSTAYRNEASYAKRSVPTRRAYELTEETEYYHQADTDSVDYQREAVKALRRAGFDGIDPQDLALILVPQDYKDELLVMSNVRAFFQVAYKRIIDSVPLSIEHELNQALAMKMQEGLVKVLNESPEHLEEMLAESPDLARERRFLNERLARLEEIQQKLDNFGR